MCVNVCSSRYTKIVQKGMDRAELILKVVMTPHDMAHAFVANFINLMKGDAEVSSFQRVLEMKVGEGRLQSAYLKACFIAVDSRHITC